VKQTPIYGLTDQYINYDEKYGILKEQGIKIFKYVHENVVDPLKENFYVI